MKMQKYIKKPKKTLTSTKLGCMEYKQNKILSFLNLVK